MLTNILLIVTSIVCCLIIIKWLFGYLAFVFAGVIYGRRSKKYSIDGNCGIELHQTNASGAASGAAKQPSKGKLGGGITWYYRRRLQVGEQ